MTVVTTKSIQSEPKDKKIIEDAKRDGIPIFVLTAKDQLSTDAILDYEVKCIIAKCSPEHIDAIHKRVYEFEAWQRENPEKVKLPD